MRQVSQVRREVINLTAIWKAAVVAEASASSILSNPSFNFVRDVVRLSKQRIQLQVAALQARHDLLDKITLEMSYGEKVHVVFEAIDTDCSGFLSAQELTVAFGKISFAEDERNYISVVKKLVADFTTTRCSELSVTDFHTFLLQLSETIDAPINDIAKYVVSTIAFGESGRDVLEDSVSTLSMDGGNRNGITDEDFHNSVIQARTLLLFDMMDLQGIDRVDPKLLVRCLSPLAEEFPSVQDTIDSLAHFHFAPIDFSKFTYFIQRIARETRMRDSHFHELVNSMTLSACHEQQAIDMQDKIQEVLAEKKGVPVRNNSHTFGCNDGASSDLIHYGKLCRLFDLFDANHDGSVSPHELHFGFQQFQKANDLCPVVATNIIATIKHHSEVSDKKKSNKNGGQLNKQEFAELMTRLACAAGSEVHRFIDFVLIQSALGRNGDNMMNDDNHSYNGNNNNGRESKYRAWSSMGHLPSTTGAKVAVAPKKQASSRRFGMAWLTQSATSFRRQQTPPQQEEQRDQQQRQQAVSLPPMGNGPIVPTAAGNSRQLEKQRQQRQKSSRRFRWISQQVSQPEEPVARTA